MSESTDYDSIPFSDEDYWPPCGMCGGEGYYDGFDSDPLWYAPGEMVKCPQCGGHGDFKHLAGSERQ